MKNQKEHYHLLIKCLYREGTEEDIQKLAEVLRTSAELRKYYHQWAETKCWLEDNVEAAPAGKTVDEIIAYARKQSFLGKAKSSS